MPDSDTIRENCFQSVRRNRGVFFASGPLHPADGPVLRSAQIKWAARLVARPSAALASRLKLFNAERADNPAQKIDYLDRPRSRLIAFSQISCPALFIVCPSAATTPARFEPPGQFGR